MKIKSFILTTMAAVALVFGVSSCGGDDDVPPVPESPTANLVAGNYSGTETMTVSGDEDKNDVIFQFTRATDSTVDMVIPAYGEGMMTLPELPVKGIILAKQDEYIAGVLPINPTTGTASYSGTVKNAKGEEKTYVVSDFMVLYDSEKNAIMVTFKLKYGNMPFEFNGVFTGQKLLK